MIAQKGKEDNMISAIPHRGPFTKTGPGHKHFWALPNLWTELRV